MKIAYLCSEYPAISHTFIMREVEALRRLGLAIETFSIRRTDPSKLLCDADRDAAAMTFSILPPRWTKLLGSHLRLAMSHPIVYLSTLRLALGLAPAGARGRLWQLFYFTEAVLLHSECRRRGLRHLHVHFANVSADVALLVARIGTATEPQRPWSWSFTMHGPTEFFDVRGHRLAEKVAAARFVVCISDFARSQLMALCRPADWAKLTVVHVGLPVDRFEPLSAAAKSGAGSREILCVGRLVPEKGQSVLLEALARLRRDGRDVGLTLVGDGPGRAELERTALGLGLGSAVDFLGSVGQDRLRGLFGGASVFCLPSFAEGIPVVLMEAMAMEVPVVTTPIAGIPELVADGRSGLLVPPGRAAELAEALERLLESEALRRELGAAGRARVLAEFDEAATAARLEALFRRRLAPQAPLATAGPARGSRTGERDRRPRPSGSRL